MWTKSYSTTISDLSIEEIWAVWSDINQWTSWQDDLEYAHINGPFKTGETFDFKPKGAPKTLHLQLGEVTVNQQFTDITRFFLATMIDEHQLIQRGHDIKIKTTIRITGALAWLWKKIVAEDIVAGLPKQTEALIKRVRETHIP